MTPLLTSDFLKLSRTDTGLSLSRRADERTIFLNAGLRVSNYEGDYLDLFRDCRVECHAQAEDSKVTFRFLGGWVEVDVECFLIGETFQCRASLHNSGADDVRMGDVCLLYFEAAADVESHLLGKEIDVFSLGALSGETLGLWSKDPGNKKSFAMRLDSTEPHYKSDNILAVRPVMAANLTPEITLGFDRLGDAACGFTIDLERGIASARVALKGAMLPSGQSRTLPTLIVDGVRPVHRALDALVDLVAQIYAPTIPLHVAIGWCSWYYYYARVREEDILDNLRYLAEHRDQLPYDYVQIDDGYQLHWGDWLLPGKKFPHDMAWLAREIAKLGFKPGIWVAPMIMTAQSNLFRDHPDWALRRHDTGEIYSMEGWSGPHENPWIVIDGTHPEYLAHIEKMFATLAHDWGYDYFKLDASSFGASDGIRHDPTRTGVQAVRLVMEAIRRGIGPNKYILGCGIPFGAAVGLVDGQRVSDDVSTAFRTEQFGCSMEVALPQSIHRSLIQGKWGHNDPDCVLVRSQGTPHESKIAEKGLSLDEAQFFVTVVGLTQGIQMVGENMMELTPERVALLETILPVIPWVARPLDLFSPHPSKLLTVTPHGLLLGLLNWTRQDVRHKLTWSELDLADSDSCEVFELWTQRYLGCSTGNLEIQIPAQGCRLLFLTPHRTRPAFIGFNGHISCGAAQLKKETWEENAKKLTIEFEANRPGDVFVLCPEGWTPAHQDARKMNPLVWSIPVSKATRELAIKFVRKDA